jgi:hypothetical protein
MSNMHNIRVPVKLSRAFTQNPKRSFQGLCINALYETKNKCVFCMHPSKSKVKGSPETGSGGRLGSFRVGNALS